jgi:hypothetical protein
MEHHHIGGWSGELKSDALIVAILVVIAVVGYVAASGRSASRSPAAKNKPGRNKPVPFRKILQGNIIQSGKNGKVLYTSII